MSPTVFFITLLLVFSSFTTQFAAGDGDGVLSAYQVLQQYDFPIGILPKGVTDYEINRETGEFAAYLNGTCSFSLEGSYQLKYQSTITGVISKDRLMNLQGVSVKVLFFWLNIVEVIRNGDQMEFSVGILSASFTIDNFWESPQCGCGLVCNSVGSSTSSLISY